MNTDTILDEDDELAPYSGALVSAAVEAEYQLDAYGWPHGLSYANYDDIDSFEHEGRTYTILQGGQGIVAVLIDTTSRWNDPQPELVNRDEWPAEVTERAACGDQAAHRREGIGW